MPKEKINAVIYARYSSSNQTEQSIEGQIHICQRYALEHNYNIINEYIDRAISGRTDNRPSFQKMIKDSVKKKFEVVLVYKLDRFSRDKYETAMYKKKLKDNGAKLVSAMENIPETPEGVILESLLEGMAQYYSMELSQKVLRGQQESRLKNQTMGGHRPYGYDVIDKKFVINKEEANVIKYIFKLYINNMSQIEIMNKLNALGIKYKDKDFIKSRISKILKDPKYAGLYEYEGEPFPDRYPAIIDIDTWEAAKLITDKNLHSDTRNSHKFLLSSKVFCGYCNNPMTGHSGTSKHGKIYYYYKCKNKKCPKTYERVNYIDKIVKTILSKVIGSRENISFISEKIAKLMQNKTAKLSDARKKQKELDQLNIEMENLVNVLRSGVKSTTISDELTKMEEQKKVLIEEINNKSIVNDQLTERQIKRYLSNAVDNNIEFLVDKLVDKVILWNGRIQIFLKFQDAIDPDNSQDFLYTKYVKEEKHNLNESMTTIINKNVEVRISFNTNNKTNMNA